jgi:hypothetical protein
VNFSGKWIAGFVFVLLFCIGAGCTNLQAGTSPQAGEGSGGNGGGSGSGNPAAGAVSYPANTYFTMDCKGVYKVMGPQGDAPWNQHGSFTLTGNVPFPITYDYQNPMGYALYNSVNPSGSSPLTIHAETEGCYGSKDDCKPCHFIYDGGMMVYNRTADPGPWSVTFMQMPGGEGTWHTISLTQTDGDCPLTIDQAITPGGLIMPASSCYTDSQGGSLGTPFTFSDGNQFAISPHPGPDNVVFTGSFKPTATFHIGTAPS